MRRTILVYALLLAAAVFLLEWLEYRYTIRAMTTEVYIVLLAVGFTILGAWAGTRLKRGAPKPFSKNHAALESLGISEREYDVLEKLARGLSNKEIARALSVSPNTVKTHVSNLYTKLGVQRRTQALDKARLLRLIP